MIDIEAVRQEVISTDPEDFFSRRFFSCIPFIFDGNGESFRRWRAKLAMLLNVDACELAIVGSAAIGCSISPYKDFRSFNDRSDIDVAVISERHFSEAWHHLRSIDLTLEPLSSAQRTSLKDHRERLIYFGCIATDKILSVLPFAQQWLSARSAMAGEIPTEGRDIKFRVYKDFRALRSYHLVGLKELKSKVLSES